MHRKKLSLFRNLVTKTLLVCFFVTTMAPLSLAQEIFLPVPGTMVRLSPAFNPPILKGIKVYPENPFVFDFILDNGDQKSNEDEASKLVKYFLASLTTRENDMWVNLSPYEKDRIVPESFGQTEMGRDLLAQDYLLKQITASLIYPEDEVGKKFWERVKSEAQKKFGTTDIPVETFNKVWIVPDKAVVYENSQSASAYVIESRLKVMLEEDYVAMQRDASLRGREADEAIPAEIASPSAKARNDTNALGSQIVREIVIPALTKEVNEGKNFGQLRQVYNSLILAAWYKRKIKDSILSKVYIDKNKVAGVNIDDPQEKQKIYEQYLEAFKKGAYNYIKEEIDPATQESIPKKYFSGGFNATRFDMDHLDVRSNPSALSAASPLKDADSLRVQIASAPTRDSRQRVRIVAKDLDAFGLKYGDMGGQAAFFTKAQWPFVLKAFNDVGSVDGDREEWERGYALAQQRLGGIVEDFMTFDLQKKDGSWEQSFIMRKAPRTLQSQINIMAQKEDEPLDREAVKKFIDANVQLIVTCLRRGVFPGDAKWDNFGLDATSNRQRIIDPGIFKDQWTPMDVVQFASRLEANGVFLGNYGEDLAEYYVKKLNEFGLGDDLVGTIPRIWNTQPPVVMNNIWPEVEASFAGAVAIQYPSSGDRPRTSSPLTDEVKKEIEDKADAFVAKLLGWQKERPSGHKFYEQTVYRYYEENVADLRAVTDPEQIKYLAQVLSQRWDTSGFKKDLGSLFNVIALQFGTQIVNAPSQLRSNYQWIYHFLEAAPLPEKTEALWTLVMNMVVHLRYLGLHPESEKSQVDFTSNEAIPLDHVIFVGDGSAEDVGLLPRFLSSLAELSQQDPGFMTAKIAPEKSNLTYEDLFLWGLVFAMDPTVYFRSGNWDLTNLAQRERNTRFLSRYFGLPTDEKNAHVRFLDRVFRNTQVNKQLSLIQPLIAKALAMTDEDWSTKGLRSPYGYEFASVYFRLALESDVFWESGDEVRLLGDPIWAFALGFQNFSDEYLHYVLSRSPQQRFPSPTMPGGMLRRAYNNVNYEKIAQEARASAGVVSPVKEAVKTKLDDAVFFVTGLLAYQRNQRPNYQEDFFKAEIVQQIVGKLGVFTDPEHIKYLATSLEKEWKKRGFVEDFGSLYNFMVIEFAEFLANSPEEMEKNYEWLYSFLDAAAPAERALAYWTLMTSMNAHLRAQGVHPEVPGTQQITIEGNSYPVDQEMLVGKKDQKTHVFQRYFLSLLELSPDDLKKVMTTTLAGQENPIKLTMEDLMLWGIVLAVDPTVYQHSQYLSNEELSKFFQRYWGDPSLESAASQFLRRGFEHPALQSQLPQIKAWVNKALARTDAQWEALGLRSPFKFMMRNSRLVRVLLNESFWSNPSRAFVVEPMTMFALQAKYFPNVLQDRLLPDPQDLRSNSIVRQHPEGLRDFYKTLDPLLASSALTEERQRQLDTIAEQFVKDLSFGPGLRQITDGEEMKYLARATQARWNAAGLDKKVGPFFTMLAINYSEEFTPLDPNEAKGIHQWVYQFLEAALPLERNDALWAMVVSNNAHMRRLGLHPEEKPALVFLDQELLLGEGGLLERFLTSYEELTPEQLAQQIKGPAGSNFTREDLLLWGVLLALDPTTYAYSADFPDAQLNERLSRYFGEKTTVQSAAAGFISRAFEGGKLKSNQVQIESLLSKAFRITEKEWEVKGLRSPYQFGLQQIYLKILLKTENVIDAIALTGVENPVFALALNLNNFTPEVQENFLSKYSGIPVFAEIDGLNKRHLREAYMAVYKTPGLAALFPRFVAGLAASSAMMTKYDRQYDELVTQSGARLLGSDIKVDDIVASIKEKRRPGQVLMVAIDGMSSAGKTTLAEELKAELEKQGIKTVHIQGDRFIGPRGPRQIQQDEDLAQIGETIRIPDIDLRVDKLRRVLKTIADFGEDPAQGGTLQLPLSELYNKKTGEINSSDLLTIGRDTIVLVDHNYLLLPQFHDFFNYSIRVLVRPSVGADRRVNRDDYQEEERLRNIYWRIHIPSIFLYMENNNVVPNLIVTTDEETAASSAVASAQEFVGLLQSTQDSTLGRGFADYPYLFFVHDDNDGTSLPSQLRAIARRITGRTEIQDFARALNREWNSNGYGKDVGSLFSYMAEIMTDYDTVAPEMKASMAWLYDFLDAAEPLEKARALRVMVISFISHLRNVGFHPEDDNKNPGLSADSFPLDQELLIGNTRDLLGPQLFQRYILSLLELQKTDLWREVIAGPDGKPNVKGLTNEDFFLWGLAILADPSIYSGDGVRGYSDAQIRNYWKRYFSDERVTDDSVRALFLKRAFNHPSIKDQQVAVHQLVTKALTRTDQEWFSHGQRSPFHFAFLRDNLRSVLTWSELWENKNQYVLSELMLMLSLDPQYFPSQMQSFLKPNLVSTEPRHIMLKTQGSRGLAPLYYAAYQSADIFPGLPLIYAGSSQPSAASSATVDAATKGGIDFQADKLNVEVTNGSPIKAFGDDKNVIKFEMTPQQLRDLENVPGFMPVIINIQPLNSVQLFLGLNKDTETQIPLYSQK